MFLLIVFPFPFSEATAQQELLVMYDYKWLSAVLIIRDSILRQHDKS